MLSALVVHKDDKQPADSWFLLMQELGYDIADREKIWLAEVNACWAHDWPT